MAKVSRRDFLRASSGAAVAAGLATGYAAGPHRMAVAAGPSERATANEKMALGFIGTAGRAAALMSAFNQYDDVEFAAFCDVYQPHLDEAVARTEGRAKGYHDFRDLLEHPGLDAVVIATPPHWHALIFAYACQAGLDVYCEKPMCLHAAEGRMMVDMARKHGRVTQIGTQIHAEENYHRVVEIVQSGILGKISVARVHLNQNDFPEVLPSTPDSDPPADLDWDMWLGPLQERPYNQMLFVDGHHRFFKETIGSWLHEMGPHLLDLPFWALGLGAPRSVAAMGGRYALQDMTTIPDTVEALFEYPDQLLTWSNQCASSQDEFMNGTERRILISFHGTNGTLRADYGAYELLDDQGRLQDVALPEPSIPPSPGHQREFLDCVKSREMCSCNVEYHYPVHLAMNLAHLSMDLSRKLHWDAETETIVGDREATRKLTPDYRDPWRLLKA